VSNPTPPISIFSPSSGPLPTARLLQPAKLTAGWAPFFRHIVHEVTSPQAFEGLANAGRKVRRNDCTLATVDHNVPTSSRKELKTAATFIKEADSRLQVVTLEENVKAFGLNYFG